MKVVRLDGADGSGVEVRFLSRAYPGGLSVFDDNWLNSEILIRGGRPWRYQAFLRCQDLVEFAAAVQGLLAGSTECALFQPQDPWLVLDVKRKGAGCESGLEVAVFAHEFDSERQRSFTFELSPAAFAESAAGFAAAAGTFPVLDRGSPPGV